MGKVYGEGLTVTTFSKELRNSAEIKDVSAPVSSKALTVQLNTLICNVLPMKGVTMDLAVVMSFSCPAQVERCTAVHAVSLLGR